MYWIFGYHLMRAMAQHDVIFPPGVSYFLTTTSMFTFSDLRNSKAHHEWLCLLLPRFSRKSPFAITCLRGSTLRSYNQHHHEIRAYPEFHAGSQNAYQSVASSEGWRCPTIPSARQYYISIFLCPVASLFNSHSLLRYYPSKMNCKE